MSKRDKRRKKHPEKRGMKRQRLEEQFAQAKADGSFTRDRTSQSFNVTTRGALWGVRFDFTLRVPYDDENPLESAKANLDRAVEQMNQAAGNDDSGN